MNSDTALTSTGIMLQIIVVILVFYLLMPSVRGIVHASKITHGVWIHRDTEDGARRRGIAMLRLLVFMCVFVAIGLGIYIVGTAPLGPIPQPLYGTFMVATIAVVLIMLTHMFRDADAWMEGHDNDDESGNQTDHQND